MDDGPVRRGGEGRPHLRPRRVRHEGGDRGGGVRRGSDPARGRRRCRERWRSAGRSTRRAAASRASRISRSRDACTPSRTDCVIIPEPLNVDRICIGHRGVYWFQVTTSGRIGHGSMPFLGVNAIEHMGVVLDRFRRELGPRLAGRTRRAGRAAGRASCDDEPERDRWRSAGGRDSDAVRGRLLPRGVRPALPARGSRRRAPRSRRCSTTPRRRAGLPLRSARSDGGAPGADAGRLAAHPGARAGAIETVLGRPAALVASPGTYDQEHVARRRRGATAWPTARAILELAHQPRRVVRRRRAAVWRKVIVLVSL